VEPTYAIAESFAEDSEIDVDYDDYEARDDPDRRCAEIVPEQAVTPSA